MKKLLLLLFLLVASYGKMEFSEPKPSFDNPRKWVMKINVDDKEVVNHILGTIYNVLKEYPSETLNVAVVVYGKGMRVLKKDYDKATLLRIKSLMEYDVEFIGCKNTMDSMKWKESDFIEDLSYAQAGVAQLIEKVVAGYIQVNPY